MRKLILSAVVLSALLIGAGGAYAAFSFTVSTSATVTGDLAMLSVVETFQGVSQTCAIGGGSASCPNVAMDAGQNYTVTMRLSNTASTASTVNFNAATLYGGSVLGISFDPPSGYVLQPNTAENFVMTVSGVGGGSDTVTLSISG